MTAVIRAGVAPAGPRQTPNYPGSRGPQLQHPVPQHYTLPSPTTCHAAHIIFFLCFIYTEHFCIEMLLMTFDIRVVNLGENES